MTEPRKIVVMGVSGCGKSTFGQALAAALGVAFSDGDDLHTAENIAKMAAGQPLDDEDRAPWLARVGAQLADEAGRVVACSALKRAYRDTIRSHAPEVVFVHLHGARALLQARMTTRPGHFMPARLLDSQLATLEPPATDERAIRVDIALPPEAQLAEVLAALGL
ncbi:gluconokinase [Abyssibius alkaniclasticus]|uniref:gluconokinase n=1 Tax=Abyssibius alkaniclasticus TaxID=2881234 RepID=UPI00236352B7|nr:gluconokinase [Abyssibius alkaniclasticus]UPH71634.1 gluconokinase [Abyssibius alkaniclasticus]